MNSRTPLILASRSPRRQHLLETAGFRFEVRIRETDEAFPDDLPAAAVAEYLARKKSAAFTDDELGGALLITADTVVVLDGTVLNKPLDREDAVQMLQALAGRAHEVYTGVCLRQGAKVEGFTDRTVVHFVPLDDAEIAYYLENFMPYDKAGAYGAQDWLGMVGIEKLEGSYFTVMGLPVHLVYQSLKSWQ
ncbi:MAG: Maf family nucleotide pyrophosphatase [Catalinimonas sp.]